MAKEYDEGIGAPGPSGCSLVEQFLVCGVQAGSAQEVYGSLSRKSSGCDERIQHSSSPILISAWIQRPSKTP